MSSKNDCEAGPRHQVEEFIDGELRCVECCRVWAPLDVSWALRAERDALKAQVKELREALSHYGGDRHVECDCWACAALANTQEKKE